MFQRTWLHMEEEEKLHPNRSVAFLPRTETNRRQTKTTKRGDRGTILLNRFLEEAELSRDET
jgi:hypothetical protein